MSRRALPFLRYVLTEYDAGALTFGRLPPMLLIVCFAAGVAGIWADLLRLSLTPAESQELAGSLNNLYWKMLGGGLGLALLYALTLSAALLYRRRRPELFPGKPEPEYPARDRIQERF